VADELAIGLAASVPIQLGWYWLYGALRTALDLPEFPWTGVFRVLSNQYADNDAGFLWFAHNLDVSFLVVHQIVLWGLAYGGGHLLRVCVRKGEWDLKTKFWRFGNPWHYLISGEATRIPDLNIARPETPDFLTWIDALTHCGNALLLYSGMLLDYELDDKGGLGSISLIEPVVRRHDELGKTGEPLLESRPVEPSSVFVIAAEKILNINITYLPIPPESPTGRLLSEFLDVESGENQGRKDSPAVR